MYQRSFYAHNQPTFKSHTNIVSIKISVTGGFPEQGAASPIDTSALRSAAIYGPEV